MLKDVLFERLYELIKQISDTRRENRNKLFFCSFFPPSKFTNRSRCVNRCSNKIWGGAVKKKKGRVISRSVLGRTC